MTRMMREMMDRPPSLAWSSASHTDEASSEGSPLPHSAPQPAHLIQELQSEFFGEAHVSNVPLVGDLVTAGIIDSNLSWKLIQLCVRQSVLSALLIITDSWSILALGSQSPIPPLSIMTWRKPSHYCSTLRAYSPLDTFPEYLCRRSMPCIFKCETMSSTCYGRRRRYRSAHFRHSPSSAYGQRRCRKKYPWIAGC